MSFLAHKTPKTRRMYVAGVFVVTLLICVVPSVVSASEMLDKIGNSIGNIILSLCAKITWIGGKSLDYALRIFVLDMSDLIGAGATSMAAAINTSWTIIRDVCNLVFIFGFVYIGIKTIIDADSGATKKFLSSLIIAALLINFSLFFTKVVIDVANIFAVEIYQLLATTPDGNPITFELVGPDGKGTGETQIADVGARFADVMGILSLYQWQGASNFLKELGNNGDIAYYFIAGLFLIVAGIVFLAGAVLILIRFVTLVFIMIFSPLLFASTVFPQTAGVAKKMWGKLFSSAFFPPVYLLLILIALRIMEQSFSQQSLLSEDLVNNGDFESVITFMVVIIFMLFALMSAQKISIAGADGIVKTAKLGMGAATAGSVAFGLRNTAGRFGAWYASKEVGMNTKAGQGLNKLGHLASTASYEARSVAGAGKAMGIGDGKASKGGYAARKKAADKRVEDEAKQLGTDNKAADTVTERYQSTIDTAQKKFKEEEKKHKQAVRDQARKQQKETQNWRKEINARRDKMRNRSTSDEERVTLANEISSIEEMIEEVNDTYNTTIDKLNNDFDTQRSKHETYIKETTQSGNDAADFARTKRQRVYTQRLWSVGARKAEKKAVIDGVAKQFNKKAENRVGGKKQSRVADDILEVVNEIKGSTASKDN